MQYAEGALFLRICGRGLAIQRLLELLGQPLGLELRRLELLHVLLVPLLRVRVDLLRVSVQLRRLFKRGASPTSLIL